MELADQPTFPFAAVVGQDEFKLALSLNLIDPTLGGVLAIGDKGTGKTTLIRSLAHLMNQHQKVPFVNLPLGVSEDRLIGNVNLEELINSKKEVVVPGLMAQAHQGILYVDEVNLLQDYLTDVLLDAAASGKYHLEREGVSRTFESRFCLVGSMNPEEGQLRPQLKDRFGLSVQVTTPTDSKTRQQVIKHRLAFDDNPAAFCKEFEEANATAASQIQAAQIQLTSIPITDAAIAYCSDLAIKHQVEGLRADILLLKTARAYAALQGEDTISTEAIDRIAPLVLNHRSANPPENQNRSQDEQQQEQELSPTDNAIAPEDQAKILIPQNDFQKTHIPANTTNQTAQKHRENPSGNTVQTDVKKSVSQYLATDKFELKNKRKNQPLTPHHIFLIDSSGSMLKDQIIGYAKGVVAKLSEQNKTQNTLFSVVSLFDGEAQILLRHTGILSDITTELEALKTGGKTNLAAGFKQIKSLCSETDQYHVLHVITDGKLNSGTSMEETVVAFQTYCKGVNESHVIDTEKGIVSVGIASDFAHQIKASYEPLILDHVG